MTGQEDARTRLRQAALELFRARGYERTTTAEIAARAGVAERTLFRHFPDKREVLFDGEAALLALLLPVIARQPTAIGPLETLFRAFRETAPLLEGNRSYSKPRQEVIASTPALFERELAKHDAMAQALAKALEARGVGGLAAELAAKVGMAAYVQAVAAWLDTPEPGLLARLDLALRELRFVAAG